MNEVEQIDESRLIKNPFWFTLQIPVTKVVSDIEWEEDIEEGLVLNKEFYIERTPSVKLYYCKDCKEIVYGLSDKAQRLYLFILLHLIPNKDWIRINPEKYMSVNRIKSLTTYRGAVKELVRYGFLASTEYRTVFWINPNLYFSGNRIKKYEDRLNVINTWEPRKTKYNQEDEN